MNSLLAPFIRQYGLVILDGGLATELESRGASIDDPLWSARLLMEDPGLIRQVHYDYLEAGAHIITTASYQASFEGFARKGLPAEKAADMMRLSVQLAKDARADFIRNHPAFRQPTPPQPAPLVAASIGPYGAFLADGSEYKGHYGLSIPQLMDFHRPRMAVLAESGADLFACETIPCFEEGLALVQLLQEFPAMSAWISFSCKDGQHVCDGGPYEDCAALADRSAQVIAIGINCTDPRFIESLIAIARHVTDTPIVTYPNKGESWDAVHKCWIPGPDPVDFLSAAPHWQAAGAVLIGGCCRTTPEDIRRLANHSWL